jgi:SAM-dependent methyltransferase
MRLSYRQSVRSLPPAELSGRIATMCEIIDPGRYEDPLWFDFHRELATYSVNPYAFRHWSGEVVRKGYEWTQCVYGLDLLGVVKPEARGLGVGAGHEPVIFWLADRVAHVTATDLYGNEEWKNSRDAEGSADVLDRPEHYCARPIARDRLTFESADGTRLPYPDASFDFCWSLSSIEHFGGHAAAAVAMREMARVTKPGGIVCVATEVMLRNKPHPEFFSRGQFARYILRASPDLAPVGPMHWSKPPREYLDDPVILWGGVRRKRRHVVMRDGSFVWTSAIAFLRKGAPNATPAWVDYLRASLPPSTRPQVRRPLYSIVNFELHNDVLPETATELLRVTTPDEPWSYAVEFALQRDEPVEGRGLEVEIAAHVRRHPVCFGVLNAGGTAFIGHAMAEPNQRAEPVKIVVPAGPRLGSLVVRSGPDGGSDVEFAIRSCKVL